jgi:carbamoyltransferase
MGLAAFGAPRPELHRFFRDRLYVDGLDLRFRPGAGKAYAFDTAAWRELEALAGGFRTPDDPDLMKAADLAFNFQRAFEDTLVDIARNFSRLGVSRNLAFAGGCALNSAANGRLVPETDFEALHVPSAPGDDGNALGALLYEKHHVRGEPRRPGVMSPFLGSAMDPKDVAATLDYGGLRYREAVDDGALCEEVADLLAQGKIVAWVQGRAEYGPRALGNRSILADPRPPDMKDRINAKVKFREFYRPLAPSILDEHGPEYFRDYQPSPYMERTLPFRDEVKARVPAVVHKDGTGRLQSVRAEWNPLYHRLISAFHRRTGVPLVLNTSFNVMGKPIVHTVQDAVAVFFTSGLDVLVIGRCILVR